MFKLTFQLIGAAGLGRWVSLEFWDSTYAAQASWGTELRSYRLFLLLLWRVINKECPGVSCSLSILPCEFHLCMKPEAMDQEN